MIKPIKRSFLTTFVVLFSICTAFTTIEALQQRAPLLAGSLKNFPVIEGLPAAQDKLLSPLQGLVAWQSSLIANLVRFHPTVVTNGKLPVPAHQQTHPTLKLALTLFRVIPIGLDVQPSISFDSIPDLLVATHSFGHAINAIINKDVHAQAAIVQDVKSEFLNRIFTDEQLSNYVENAALIKYVQEQLKTVSTDTILEQLIAQRELVLQQHKEKELEIRKAKNQHADQNKLSTLIQERDALENKQGQYQCIKKITRDIDTLAKRTQELFKLIASSFETEKSLKIDLGVTQQLLSGYIAARFTKEIDIKKAYAIIESYMQAFGAPLDQEYTRAAIATVLDATSDSMDMASREELVFLYFSSGYANQSCPLHETQTLKYHDKEFANCADKAVQNIFTMVLHNPETDSIDVTRLPHSAKDSLKTFYALPLEEQTPQRWLDIVSNLPGIAYSTIATDTNGQTINCEVRGFATNLLRIIAHLLGKEELTAQLTEDITDETFIAVFNQLMEPFKVHAVATDHSKHADGGNNAKPHNGLKFITEARLEAVVQTSPGHASFRATTAKNKLAEVGLALSQKKQLAYMGQQADASLATWLLKDLIDQWQHDHGLYELVENVQTSTLAASDKFELIKLIEQCFTRIDGEYLRLNTIFRLVNYNLITAVSDSVLKLLSNGIDAKKYRREVAYNTNIDFTAIAAIAATDQWGAFLHKCSCAGLTIPIVAERLCLFLLNSAYNGVFKHSRKTCEEKKMIAFAEFAIFKPLLIALVNLDPTICRATEILLATAVAYDDLELAQLHLNHEGVIRYPYITLQRRKERALQSSEICELTNNRLIERRIVTCPSSDAMKHFLEAHEDALVLNYACSLNHLPAAEKSARLIKHFAASSKLLMLLQNNAIIVDDALTQQAFEAIADFFHWRNVISDFGLLFLTPTHISTCCATHPELETIVANCKALIERNNTDYRIYTSILFERASDTSTVLKALLELLTPTILEQPHVLQEFYDQLHDTSYDDSIKNWNSEGICTRENRGEICAAYAHKHDIPFVSRKQRQERTQQWQTLKGNVYSFTKKALPLAAGMSAAVLMFFRTNKAGLVG